MTARIYVRVSRPDEAPILENQKERAIAHVRGLGFTKWEVYDETASGGDEDRLGLGRLIKSLHPGDLVVFTALSRMTRGGIGAALDILKQLERAGAGWHFIDQPDLNWDSGTPKLTRDILLSIFAAIDEDYRTSISVATRNAYTARRNLAEARGETVKWGYPKGRPRSRCARCGGVPNANVHRARYHGFRRGEDGACAVCGRSPKARGHVVGHHPFQKALPPPHGDQDPASGIAPISDPPGEA